MPGEIYVSERQNGARFGPATAVTELNDATANDIQPNVRADGLGVVFKLQSIRDTRCPGHLVSPARARITVQPGLPLHAGGDVAAEELVGARLAPSDPS